MTFDEYQKQSLTTAIDHPDPLMNKTIFVMGLAGEAGEVLEKWKKIVAYYDGEITEERLEDLKKEIGDVMWYIALLAENLGLKMSDIAQYNVDKLADRKKRDVQRGEGDDR